MKQKTINKKRGRKPKSKCLSLILLDTSKIRKEYHNKYKRRKKVLERIEVQLQQYKESDEVEFQKFLAIRFGAEQTRQREIANAIHLWQGRFEKIRFLADYHGMSKERFCYSITEKVTAENDFWAILELELENYAKEEQKREEDFYDDECDEDEDFARWDREYAEYCNSCNDEDDDNDYSDFKSMFDDVFGGLFSKEEPLDELEEKSLKSIYRELCLKYHPDKIGNHDDKIKRLWNAIQNAYQEKDINKLRAIHAQIEIDEGKRELACSEIDNMIEELEWTISAASAELRSMKRTPFWGFSTWSIAKKKQAQKEIKLELDYAIEEAKSYLQKIENDLKKLMAYKPKPKKKTKAQLKKEALDQLPDLFDDIF